MEHHTTAIIIAAHLGGCLQQARRRGGLVEIEFGVALVGGDDKIVLIGKLDELLQVGHISHRTRGVARGAKIDQLTPLPYLGGYRVQVRQEAVLGTGVEEIRFGPGEQSGPLIDLIERVGGEHQRIACAVHHRLGKGEQCLASAGYRQHMAFSIHRVCRKAEPGSQPIGDRLP